jgi:hypothetical protein
MNVRAASTGAALRFALRELEVVLEVPSSEPVEWLSHLVNHAEDGFAPADTLHMRYVRTGERGREVFESGSAEPKKVCCDEVAGGYILYRMSTRLLMLYSGKTAVHCGAASIDGRLLLFTGDRGAGKTTLLLRLMLDGADFHCDEMLLAHDGVATTLPRRLHVKEGTLACIPELAEVCEDKPFLKYGTGARFYPVDPVELGHAWASASRRPSAIFHLQPAFGGPPELAPVSQVQMVKTLMCQTLSGHQHIGRQVADLTSMVRGVPCFSLRIGPLRASAGLVCRAVEHI